MSCQNVLQWKCDKSHIQSYKCHQGVPLNCRKCEKEQKAADEAKRQAFMLQEKRDAEQAAHLKEVAQLEAEIAREREAARDIREAKARADFIRQKKRDLEETKARIKVTNHTQRAPRATPSPPHSIEKPTPNEYAAQAAQANGGGDLPQPAPRTHIPPPSSAAREEWNRRKDVENASNDAIEEVMRLTGLEEIKQKFLEILDKIDTAHRRGTDLKKERFNIVFLGNPGTGKTTVARLYAKFLASLQVLPGSTFVETTGARLANEGVAVTQKRLEEVTNSGGGAVFIDEAYQLTAEHNYQGRQVLDFLLAEMENNVGTMVFILAGYNKEMERFFEHNPGLSSRVLHRMQFKDYTDAELQAMFTAHIHQRFKGRMDLEGGFGGLYQRIGIRRLGRGREAPGFGNARALQNMADRIFGQQATRLARERRQGLSPDDFALTKEDLIGPEPSEALHQNPAWERLQKLTGLDSVKQSVRQFIEQIQTNYWREISEEKPLQVSLNRVFLGSPGTGKTIVAKLYGQILADLGLLSNGEIVLKNPADFIGSALGQSESHTKAILATTVGKVLVIDEAYMLFGGSDSGSKSTDIYKTAVIDTIVAEVQSVPGEDRCVLLLGYKDQMEDMFQNVNPGLARRFAIENAFTFNDFTDEELMEILNFKLKDQQLHATDAAKKVAIEMLGRSRRRPNFGNAGEVEILISQAKGRQQARVSLLAPKDRSTVIFEPQDFDPGFNRGIDAATNLVKLFEDIVGCEDIISRLSGYQKVAQASKTRGMDLTHMVPTNFVFTGPPGTGKTTVAHKMGQVYYEMGFLSSAEVLECSASDLVGQYAGQTGGKTKKLLEKALGRVLFIDEAYRLSEGQFAKEAIDELVTLLTQKQFLRKVIVILAGYDADMERLLAVNSGLSSRFSEHIIFEDMNSKQCLDVLRRELIKTNIFFPGINDPTSNTSREIQRLLEKLSKLPSWGNVRDVNTLAKKMANEVLIGGFGSTTELILDDATALTCIRGMLQDRLKRQQTTPSQSKPPPKSQPPVRVQGAPEAPRAVTSVTTAKATAPQKQPPKPVPPKPTTEGTTAQRDPGVTDQVWRQLQADRRAAEDVIKKRDQDIAKLERDAATSAQKARIEAQEAARLKKIQVEDAEARAELKRKLEEARLREQQLKAEKRRAMVLAEARRKAAEEAKRKEMEVQTKLRQMGVCVMGYRWIKQAHGYRCAGGSHTVSNAELGL